MSKIKVAPYDSAEFLGTPEAVAAYMDEALESNDAALISHALGVVARAKSMTEIARKTGLSRESLYRALSAEGKPELGTVMKVLAALDLQLKAEPVRHSPPKRAAPRKHLAAQKHSGRKLMMA